MLRVGQEALCEWCGLDRWNCEGLSVAEHFTETASG